MSTRTSHSWTRDTTRSPRQAQCILLTIISAMTSTARDCTLERRRTRNSRHTGRACLNIPMMKCCISLDLFRLLCRSGRSRWRWKWILSLQRDGSIAWIIVSVFARSTGPTNNFNFLVIYRSVLLNIQAWRGTSSLPSFPLITVGVYRVKYVQLFLDAPIVSAGDQIY